MYRIRPIGHRATDPIRGWRFAGFALFLSSCTVFSAPHGYYTPQEAYGSAEALAGTTVTVRGKIEIVSSTCTLEGCPPENPCCNGCYHQLGFRVDAYRSLQLAGSNSGCTGNSCQNTCPFIDPSKTYEVTGRLTMDAGQTVSLNMSTWKAIE
jgi:hypothetical protein